MPVAPAQLGATPAAKRYLDHLSTVWARCSAGAPRVEFKRGLVTVDPAHAAAAQSPILNHSQQRLTLPMMGTPRPAPILTASPNGATSKD